MSVLTANAMLMAPAAATAPALNLNGSSFAYGTWTLFIAATAGQAQIAGFVVYPGTWSNGTMDIDVGIGLAGAEVSLATPVRFELANSGGNGPTTYMLPAPISGIPAGAAVSLRMRCNTAVSVAPLVKLIYYLNLDSDHQVAYVTGAHPVTAAPAVVTPSGAAWTPSTAVTLIASLTNNAYVYGLGILFPALGQESEFDICTGPTSAVVLDTLRGQVGFGSATFEPRMSYLHLPALKLVAAGTKVSVIMRHSSTSVSTYKIALLYYDAPTPPAVPSPATDYPCNIKTPVFMGGLNVAGSSFAFAMKPLRDPSTWPAPSIGGYKPPRLASMGTISRVASDWLTGAWAAQTASMKLIDFDRTLRRLLATSGQGDFLGGSAYFYLFSEATRLTQGNPTLLFRGPVYDNPLSEHLTYTLRANDPISVAFNLFQGDPQIPARLVGNGGLQNPSGRPLGVPIIYGPQSDEAYGTPIGRLQAIDVGNLVVGGTTYAVGLIAGHACAGGILNAYQNNALITTWGTDAWAPGQSGWSTIQPSGALYFDINGFRYTLIFLTGSRATNFQNGSQPVYVNVNGIEPNADGTGSYISDLFLQDAHAMVNWLGPVSYQSGPWLPTPTFPFYPGGASTLPVFDLTTWTDASNVAKTYLGSGWLGGFVWGANGTRISVRTALQQLNVSENGMLGLNSQSQIIKKTLDRRRTNFINAARTITDRRDILDEPQFQIEKKMDWYFSTIAYPFKPNYRLDGRATNPNDTQGPYEITAEAQTNEDSRVRFKDVTVTQAFDCIRDTATADAVATQRLAFASIPPRIATWARSLCGMSSDVLTGHGITDFRGMGTNGWINNAVWILSQQLDPATGKVIFTGVDVNHLLS